MTASSNLFRPFIRTDNNGDRAQIVQSDCPVSKVVCVGRNYVAHAKELNNPVPKTPLLFIKPESSLCHLAKQIFIPVSQGECHFETELAILMKSDLSNAASEMVISAIEGVGLALDLTLRDLQSSLKAKGHPWEKAKAFDGSCPVTDFIPLASLDQPLSETHFELIVNEETRQIGQVEDMIFPITQLIATISSHFTLRKGDIVLTGTPAGVGALHPGDRLELCLNGRSLATAEVASR